MKLEEKMFPRNLKGIEKGLDISGFEIVKYSVRCESGHIVALWYQVYYSPGLPKDLCIIYLQGIFTPEGYKVTLISHYHDEHDSYAELNFKEENTGW